MNYLLKRSSFTDEQNADPQSVYTKFYQHIEVNRLLDEYIDRDITVCEIGPHTDFRHIERLAKARRSILDPYNNAGGHGRGTIPASMPYPVVIYRCLLGVDSWMVQSDHFDLTYSVSVLEHIGQEEAGFDCTPAAVPPPEQETPRNAFCQELFRVTKPGGVTFHTIDHAARNLSYLYNFTTAGFEPLFDMPPPTYEECQEDPDAVRQLRNWFDHVTPLHEGELRLHGVLLLAFRKPVPKRRFLLPLPPSRWP